MSLSSQSFIVTGGAGGLGLAITKALLRAGAFVTVCDISQSQLDSLAWPEPDKVLKFLGNVTQEEAVSKLFEAAQDKFGRVDGLVNNAGIMDRFDPIGEVSKEKWDQVMSVNVTGPMLCTQQAVKTFLAKGDVGEGQSRGKIVNVASASIHRTMSAGTLVSPNCDWAAD